MFRDLKRYKINKTGLARVIELRGGIETLDSMADIRLMILWYILPLGSYRVVAHKIREDVCGACAFDIAPNYLLPTNHIPLISATSYSTLPTPFLTTMYRWKSLYAGRNGFLMVFRDLFLVNAMIQEGFANVCADPWFLGLKINPIILRLLSGSKLSLERVPGATIEMACRLAALIYLGDVRVGFMEYHITGYHFMERLKDVVVQESEEWQNFPELRLWVLVIGGIKASAADQDLFVCLILESYESLALNTWDQVTDILEKFMWLDEIYGARCADLGLQVLEMLVKKVVLAELGY